MATKFGNLDIFANSAVARQQAGEAVIAAIGSTGIVEGELTITLHSPEDSEQHLPKDRSWNVGGYVGRNDQENEYFMNQLVVGAEDDED